MHNSSGIVVQVPCPPSSTVKGYFYKHFLCEYNTKRSVLAKTGQVSILFMMMPLHPSLKLLRLFLASENVKVVSHPPYSPDLSPYDFSYFQN